MFHVSSGFLWLLRLPCFQWSVSLLCCCAPQSAGLCTASPSLAQPWSLWSSLSAPSLLSSRPYSLPSPVFLCLSPCTSSLCHFRLYLSPVYGSAVVESSVVSASCCYWCWIKFHPLIFLPAICVYNLFLQCCKKIPKSHSWLKVNTLC